VPALRALHAATQIVGVVCQPDRRAGRGMHLSAPPVKQAALELDLPVHQPERVRSGELERWLIALQADVALVAAYGRILPRGVLDAPRRGCMNLHASILPGYRGAAPIQWAILQGETQTGISLMQMDEGMDTGPVYATRRIAIPPSMNGGELTEALAALAAEMVGDEMLAAVEGRLQATAQDSSRATSAPPIRREHLAIDWAAPSARVVCQIRAFAPVPGAFTWSGGRRLKVLEARLGGSNEGAPPGQVLATGPGKIEIACGSGSVELLRAQSDNGKPQGARDLLNGRLIQPGQLLGPEGSAG
jgi:methionyl-tRNA formyltransferase